MAITLPEIRPIAAIRDDEENAKPYTVPVLLSKDHKKILKKKQVPRFPVFFSYGGAVLRMLCTGHAYGL